MFNDFDTQIQSDELAPLHFFEDTWYDNDIENEEWDDDDADCFCD